MEQLDLHIDNIDHKATPEDLLYEIQLKTGFKPTGKIETQVIASTKVFSVADNVLLLCLEYNVAREQIDNTLAVFENFSIRRVYDETTETWYFSVVDIIGVLIQQPDYQAARNYWKVLKNRLNKEGSESVTKCNRLKLPAFDEFRLYPPKFKTIPKPDPVNISDLNHLAVTISGKSPILPVFIECTT